MAGKHSIKNKLLDVKKALSKNEMTKLNNKYQNYENSNARHSSEWNGRGSGDGGRNDGWSGHRGSSGPHMNMEPNMGYGSGSSWGECVQTDTIEISHLFV